MPMVPIETPLLTLLHLLQHYTAQRNFASEGTPEREIFEILIGEYERAVNDLKAGDQKG